MSWFARSIVNTLRLDPDPQSDSDEEQEHRGADTGRKVSSDSTPTAEAALANEEEDEAEANRGVKDDISELTQTITRQLWGVASFLAPPPQTRSESPAPSIGTGPDPSEPEKVEEGELEEASDSPRFAGIRSDFAEIGGRFRSGISRLSSNKAVTEISKIASTFLPFGPGEEEEEDEEEEGDEGDRYGRAVGAIGVTEEVLAFARNISMHPETWLDFPLLPDEDDADDFDMSDAQQEHALAVERLAPRLAALRIELCPSHMSEGCFWKIYFVLLHPRLNKEDAERLSTPQIVEARALLLQELQNRTKSEADRLARSVSYTKDPVASTPTSEYTRLFSGSFVDKQHISEESAPSTPTADSETDKHPVVMTEIKIVDKNVVEEQPPSQGNDLSGNTTKVPIEGDDDGDEWLQEDDDAVGMGGSRTPFIPIGNDEDVSFSDLEDDDDTTTSSKMTSNKSTSDIRESKDWVQLNKSFRKDTSSTSPDTKEASDWLNIDDIDDV